MDHGTRPGSRARLPPRHGQHQRDGGLRHPPLPDRLRHRRDPRPDDRHRPRVGQPRHHRRRDRPGVRLRLLPVDPAAAAGGPRARGRPDRRPRGRHAVDRDDGGRRQPGHGRHPGRDGRRTGQPGVLALDDARADGGVLRGLARQPPSPRARQGPRPDPPLPRRRSRSARAASSRTSPPRRSSRPSSPSCWAAWSSPSPTSSRPHGRRATRSAVRERVRRPLLPLPWRLPSGRT